MGRILVIHPQRGLLELLKRVLDSAHHVAVCDTYEAAMEHLNKDGAYDAVFCGLDQDSGGVEIFETALDRSSKTRLVAVARDEPQAHAFFEQWRAETKHKKLLGNISNIWLAERCTAGEILAVLKTSPQQPGKDVAVDEPTPERSSASVKPGNLIDGYRLQFQIGAGGFGSTWFVVNEVTGRHAALKLVEGDEQLRQEVAAMEKYVHVANRSKHLIQIEHINRDPSRLWLVTPLADSMTGGYTAGSYRPLSLENQLQAKGHIAEKEAARIASDLVRALLALHDAGLLHGDVSPPNILRVSGRWVVADPGLVRFIGQHGICRNRTYYPQAAAKEPRDDLYAVGVTLWHMISGIEEIASNKESLRLDASLLALIAKKNLPAGDFICRALAENPKQQYASAEVMLRDLESLAANLATEPGSGFALYETLSPFRTI